MKRKIENIGIIGIGSLGGFVAQTIAYIEFINTIKILDDDKVFSKNLHNSIFRKEDVGKYKVNVLKEIIGTRKKIIPYQEKYIECIKKSKHSNLLNDIIDNTNHIISCEKKLCDCDLILDCRDYTYDRFDSRICRFYISSRYLVVDCRRNVEYEKKKIGKYLTKLSKNDMQNAANIIAKLIEDKTIFDIIENKGVKEFDLDYLKRLDLMKSDINNSNLINLQKFQDQIISKNQTTEISILLCSKNDPIKKERIPKNKIQNYDDLFLILNNFISNFKNKFNLFIVSFNNDSSSIILIPETGAA
jgi:hypothetical protein